MVLQPLLGYSTDFDVAQYGCTIDYPSPENSGIAVGISSLSSIVLGISKFFIFSPWGGNHSPPGARWNEPKNPRTGYGITIRFGANVVKINSLQLFESDFIKSAEKR